jgi:hypothetical protein
MPNEWVETNLRSASPLTAGPDIAPASTCRCEQENQRSGSARHHDQLVIVSS